MQGLTQRSVPGRSLFGESTVVGSLSMSSSEPAHSLMDDRNIRNICKHCSALWINHLKQWFPNLVFIWWTPAEPSTQATIFTNAFIWMDFFFSTRCWLYKYDNTIFPHKKTLWSWNCWCVGLISFFFFSVPILLCATTQTGRSWTLQPVMHPLSVTTYLLEGRGMFHVFISVFWYQYQQQKKKRKKKKWFLLLPERLE